MRSAMPRTTASVAAPVAPDVPIIWVALATLRPHPRNDGSHPPDELAHLKQSLQEHGVYRNVVIADDGTILAGHGVVAAAQQLGHTQILARRMPYGPHDPQALKILVGDNQIPRWRLWVDAMLTALLKELSADDPLALLGTGFDEAALEALVQSRTVPDFQPVGIDEQGRLDRKEPITCPECGAEFTR